MLAAGLKEYLFVLSCLERRIGTRKWRERSRYIYDLVKLGKIWSSVCAGVSLVKDTTFFSFL